MLTVEHKDESDLRTAEVSGAPPAKPRSGRSMKKPLLAGAMLVLLFVIVLGSALGGADELASFAVRSFFTLLGRGPVVVVENHTSAPALDVTVRFEGGSARWDSLSPEEVVKQALWLQGESALSVSWRTAEGGEQAWVLDCYFERTWYERVTIILTPDGGITATDMGGALKAVPAPVARVVQ